MDKIVRASFYDLEERKTLNLDADLHWDSNDYKIEHDHDFWEFWAVTDGKCNHYINGKSFIMEKGASILIRPKDYHYVVKSTSDFSHINFALKESLATSYLNFIYSGAYQNLMTGEELFYNLKPDELEKLIRYATEFLTVKSQKGNIAFISHALCSFVFELVLSSNLNKNKGYPQLVYDLIYEINKPENLSAFSKDIVEKFHYSHQYVERIFKFHTGDSLSNYINKVKMQKACDMLSKKSYTTLEISGLLGFNSLSHFTRLFKKIYGVPPKKYKK